MPNDKEYIEHRLSLGHWSLVIGHFLSRLADHFATGVLLPRVAVAEHAGVVLMIVIPMPPRTGFMSLALRYTRRGGLA